jgi:hypothetical protein
MINKRYGFFGEKYIWVKHHTIDSKKHSVKRGEKIMSFLQEVEQGLSEYRLLFGGVIVIAIALVLIYIGYLITTVH